MRLYLDEDTSWGLLVHVLRHEGHDIETPAGAGLSGESDPVQLTYAIKENRRVLTRNYEDFEDLHNLVIDAAGGHHPGILVIRRDNNPRRNMAPHDVARALRNLEAAGVPIADQYIVLNMDGNEAPAAGRRC